MASGAEHAAVWLFGGWFALSVAAQLSPALLRYIRRHDVFCLVPRWNFFAPVPGTVDLVLLYRDRDDTDALTRWREVRSEPPLRVVSALWNPGRRHRKAVFDACQQLAADVAVVRRERRPPAVLTVSVPYLLLLNHISGIRPTDGVGARQFAIVSSPGLDDGERPTPMFLSGVHAIEGPPGRARWARW